LKQSRGLPGELLNLISGLFQFFVTCRLVFERSKNWMILNLSKANKNHKQTSLKGLTSLASTAAAVGYTTARYLLPVRACAGRSVPG
jgi:hypothetical protein